MWALPDRFGGTLEKRKQKNDDNLLGPEGDESLKAAWGPRISDPTEASDNSSVQRRIVHLSHT
jgi:hypothetical protein